MRRSVMIGFGLVTLVTAGCSGGGGQLASNQIATESADTTTTTAAPVASSIPVEEVVTTVAPEATTTTIASTAPIPTDQLKGPKTAQGAAKQLERIERKLRGSNRDPALLLELGRAQQLVYRALSAHPGWVDNVLDALPSHLKPQVQANIDAGNALGGLTGEDLPTSMPQWAILTPEPAATLRAYYDEGEQAYGIPWEYLAAIHFVETRMGRIRGLSPAGAQGPMQFIPETWAAYGQGDINSNHDAIVAAARYLEANGAASDIDSALFRYNNDDRYVEAIKAYASVLMADAGAYDGYYHWQVFFASTAGTFLLPEGWSAV